MPVEISCNQVTVIGDSNATECESPGSAQGDAPAGDSTTSGEDGAVSGNQSVIDADVPVEVGGNQITVIGQGNTSSSSQSGGTSDDAETADGEEATSGSGGAGAVSSSPPTSPTGRSKWWRSSIPMRRR